ncbi:dioxygenase [Streptomyces griseoaurantiacus]|jgi:4,5-DOPA dioxygenase extradiol|uniref:Extradiol ring-cleavage dioxygenase III subunit B n=4 Tax=Streptomyces griseoaurantiacus TaxID=68213 RepID=F3NSC2_9ACTN|nr:extradiol ring-cleavage dioxygenase III subunit B [Streptomyces griseoaurantiacus M045]MCF0090188.1 4,5-DOPA dioxygenase extradiol [Streptomyces sp. MH192]MCF0102404.1 4,5-DOPA dioxygenase extradiol [Streptomyces sp. MH191]GHE55104.1 dioxygenase [Streptomyces griseoaurantiacus]SDF68516.1 4,5-DOPA dioxygenase extradiol [Streptomyces jietaisiensis]
MSALAEERPAAGRMPTLYLSHGAPPLADDPVWPGELSAWSATLPRPRAILMVSAHWEDAPLALGAVEPVPLVYDFWGFPEHYYRVRYEAPGAPALADSVRKLLRAPGTPVQDVPDRGLDHGAYVPLVEMYPEADIPVLQISMPTLDPVRLMEIGRRLAPLRDEGVLIVGSGFFTHNLAALRHAGGIPGWSAEFDDWGQRALAAGDVDALLDFTRTSPAGQLAHPRTEHFAPLFVTLGAADAAGELDTQRSVIEGFWLGLAKRSVQFG